MALEGELCSATTLNLTEETISGTFYVRNPNYNFSGNSVYSSLNISSSDKTDSSGYENTKTGFSVGSEFEQWESIFLSPSLTAAHEKIEVQSSASSAMKKMEGTYSNVDFAYGITMDKRNQVFQPTAGYRAKFLQTLPLILDSSSLLNGIDVSAYRTISEDVIGAVKFRARSILGLGGDDVRVTSRLYLPSRQLRGFKAGKVGPKDGEDWIGGKLYYSTSI